MSYSLPQWAHWTGLLIRLPPGFCGLATAFPRQHQFEQASDQQHVADVLDDFLVVRPGDLPLVFGEACGERNAFAFLAVHVVGEGTSALDGWPPRI
jgi:hypothetical protein